MKLTDICTKVDTKRGAPMGRFDVGTYPVTIVRGRRNRICKCDQTKVYTKHISLTDGYDIGGAYWGIGEPLYVEFTKDLSYIHFYRLK